VTSFIETRSQRPISIHITNIMASHASVSQSLLTENDIPGASLGRRNPSELKNDELKFWLKCRGDPGKGLKTKAELVKRYVVNDKTTES